MFYVSLPGEEFDATSRQWVGVVKCRLLCYVMVVFKRFLLNIEVV